MLLQTSSKLEMISSTLERMHRSQAPQKWLLWMGTNSMVQFVFVLAGLDSSCATYSLLSRPAKCSLCLLHTQVANAVFSFPLAKYAKDGFDLVVGGRPERVLAGDAWGGHR